MRFYGTWMTAGVRRLVGELHAKDPFDVIDGHYVYPDGTAAVRLGEELGLPVVLSARGTDLNLYPAAPRHRAPDPRQPGVVPPSRLRLRCVEAGRPGPGHARGEDQRDRQRRGWRPLPSGRPARGPQGSGPARGCHRHPLRGPHDGAEGIPPPDRGLCARLGRGDVVLVIAGDGRRARGARVAGRLPGPGAAGCVSPGPSANEDLPAWYQAADLFALASSREGWPNVLCEAQACGLPAVATEVWGVPEIIRREELGVLVEERTVEGLRAGLEAALARTWDRASIESAGRSRTWDRVAEELAVVFDAVGGRSG